MSPKRIRQPKRLHKTSAGKKIAVAFPIIMIQSLRAAEMITEMYTR